MQPVRLLIFFFFGGEWVVEKKFTLSKLNAYFKSYIYVTVIVTKLNMGETAILHVIPPNHFEKYTRKYSSPNKYI